MAKRCFVRLIIESGALSQGVAVMGARWEELIQTGRQHCQTVLFYITVATIQTQTAMAKENGATR